MSINDRSKELKLIRVGEIGVNNFGTKMTIIKYVSAINIIVNFENGFTTTSTYRQFKKGEIRNPYDKTIFNVGYLGEGTYMAKSTGEYTKQYRSWRNMMERCYNPKIKKLHPTYEHCFVCDDWHNYQSYAKWFDDNYYQVKGELMHLDKDICIKGNKIYSPDTCVFVPQCINVLFIKRDNFRGDYPIGVSLHERVNSADNYQAVVNDINNIQKYIGVFDTIEEAFNAYKIEKEKIIKEIADIYKDRIPTKLYEAMYNYQVNIND